MLQRRAGFRGRFRGRVGPSPLPGFDDGSWALVDSGLRVRVRAPNLSLLELRPSSCARETHMHAQAWHVRGTRATQRVSYAMFRNCGSGPSLKPPSRTLYIVQCSGLGGGGGARTATLAVLSSGASRHELGTLYAQFMPHVFVCVFGAPQSPCTGAEHSEHCTECRAPPRTEHCTQCSVQLVRTRHSVQCSVPERRITPEPQMYNTA